MIQKTINWIPTNETKPTANDVIIVSFEKRQSKDDKNSPISSFGMSCFANYSVEEKKFYDLNWDNFFAQPTYWAYYVGPFDEQ